MDAVLHQLPPVKGYSKRTSADKDAAKAADKKTHVELRALRSNDANNKHCADCTASLTGWASLPHGVFLCIACAQVHRSLGRHMAQVKSFSSGTYLWYPDEVAAMRLMGNANAAELYASKKKGAPPKPDKDAPAHIKDNYIRDKYERLKWVDPDFSYSSKLKTWVRKGKERLKAATATMKSSRSPPSSESSSSSASSSSLLGASGLSFASGYMVVTDQPRTTSAVYGGANGKSLLDDDRSTRDCKAACLPVLSGLSIFKPSSRSRWSCNNTTSYGTATTAAATTTASYASTPSKGGGSQGTGKKDDFFASWGL